MQLASRFAPRSPVLRSETPLSDDQIRAVAPSNPDDDLFKEVRLLLTSEPERYATYTREYLGWGVFALMPR